MNSPASWWESALIYQIYPRSFFDSNGDGIGDLPGITDKLDYLAYLGVDAIWLSPIFTSPMADFGYDISDYRGIAPEYGSLEDARELIRRAHELNIRVIFDLVFNHSSEEHPWFADARQSREAEHADWYIWHNGKKPWLFAGKRKPRVPNNWMAAFGGRAWTWEPARNQYYLHLFLSQQPDFNWRNPEVKKQLLSEAEFWLNQGVDGFRLDVINYIVKDREFRNNPYRIHPGFPRRHDQQDHVHDRNQPETHEILRDFRRLMDDHGETMLVGEIYPNEGVHDPQQSAAYQGSGTDELHLSFNFSTIFAKYSAKHFRQIFRNWYEALGESRVPSHVLSNHDQSRAMSRLCRGDESRARVLAAMLLLQKGAAFVYYGEEIGMADGRIPHARMQDPLGRKYWPLHPGRDRCRTPMQWDSTSNMGFSSGVPWLPINSDGKNVTEQRERKASLLQWYRFLIKLRKHAGLQHWGIMYPGDDRNVLEIVRVKTGDSHLVESPTEQSDERIRILLNFSSRTTSYMDIELAPSEGIIDAWGHRIRSSDASTWKLPEPL